MVLLSMCIRDGNLTFSVGKDNFGRIEYPKSRKYGLHGTYGLTPSDNPFLL